MFDNILFDLDGTLTDPGVGITNSVMYALKHWGIEVTERHELYCFIGPPLMDSFQKYYGFSQAESEEALRLYREYFSEKGLYENELYPDTTYVLNELKKSGKRIILATSKPEEYAVKILKHFNIYDFFDFVSGATMDESRNKKDEVIEYTLKKCNLQGDKRTVMIGDRDQDILGAKANSLPSIGVLYGYGDLQELQNAGADFIAQTQKDILKFI